MDIMYRHPAGVSEEKETAGRLEAIGQEVRKAAKELLEEAQMERGQIMVVGCSSSEIAAHRIGSYSSGAGAKGDLPCRTVLRTFKPGADSGKRGGRTVWI